MKMVRVLLVSLLVCGSAYTAKADDFQLIVVDPSYTVVTIPTLAFTFMFSSPCVSPGQVPLGANYDACFTGQNETGQTLTALQITVPNSIANQSAGCAPSGLTNGRGQPLDIFGNISCGPGPGGVGYVLTYSGGNVAQDGIFTIAERGAAATDFGTVGGVFTPAVGTPEPGAIWLLSTGVLSGASLVAKRRRRPSGARTAVL